MKDLEEMDYNELVWERKAYLAQAAEVKMKIYAAETLFRDMKRDIRAYTYMAAVIDEELERRKHEG